jgi:AcrR family transcriptional regulator
MAKRADIRVQVTRKILRDSLIGLMETKSILQISVKEICERAGVSSSTFYTYYNDQFDLLRQIEDQSFMDSALMRQKYKGIKKLGNQGILRLFEEVLRHIADNRARFRSY